MAALFLALGTCVWSARALSDRSALAQLSELSLRPAPASAHVVERSTPLFGLRANACAYARIELSGADYQTLLAQLEADTRLRSGYDRVSEGVHSARKTAFVQPTAGAPGAARSLQFLGDGRNVEINLCVG